MDVVDAFTEEAITRHGTNIEGDEESQVRDVIQRIFVNNEINWSDEIVSVALLSFVAGRTYQADQSNATVTVEMDGYLVSRFLRFLQEGQE